ncbi:MAG TPA: zinc ribbon domain-containing protein [Gaiellales bacterium]|nr:zinc ribbon domain-containing protein [Gaiellales bacterium]
MPYCRHCGVEHAGSDRYCPSCGRPIPHDSPSTPAAAGPTRAPGERLGVPDVLGHALTAIWRARLWRLFLTVVLATVVQVAAIAAGLAAVVYASFSTFDYHRILRTSCFHATTRSGATTGFTVTPNCDPLRARVDVPAMLAAGLAALVLATVVTTLAYLAIYRRCDREAGNGVPRRPLPGAGPIGRAAGRAFGWGTVISVGVLLVIVAAAVPLAVTASSTAGGSEVLLMLGEIAALAYLAIRWVVPFLIRLQFAYVRMLLDDRPLPACVEEMRRLSRGQAWAYLGLLLAVSIGASFATSIAAFALASMPGGTYATQFAFQVAATMVTTSFTIAMMRNIAGELATPGGAGTDAAQPGADASVGGTGQV